MSEAGRKMSNHYQRGQRKNCSFLLQRRAKSLPGKFTFPGRLSATADIEKLCFEMALAEAEESAFAGKEAELKRQKKLINKAAALGVGLSALFAQTASATAVVTQKLGSLNELVLGIVTAAGVIVLAWGIFEFATAYQSHDTSQQTMSLKKVVSGIIMVTAPQIINLLK